MTTDEPALLAVLLLDNDEAGERLARVLHDRDCRYGRDGTTSCEAWPHWKDWLIDAAVFRDRLREQK